MFIPYISKGLDLMQMLIDLVRYFSWTVVEGDWLNDWLTHLPLEMKEPLIEMGKAVAFLFHNGGGW